MQLLVNGGRRRDENLELVGYSGAFDPDFKPDKLSRETLLKIVKTYSEYIRRVDGHWYVAVMDRWGNGEALDCDVRIWEKLCVWELRTMTNLLNIHGDDVLTMMKAQQASPWMSLHDYSVDIKSSDHAILTIRNCAVLTAIEKEGSGREKQQCHEVEPRMWRAKADYFNPNIEITALKLAPRKGPDEIACQWEFKLTR